MHTTSDLINDKVDGRPGSNGEGYDSHQVKPDEGYPNDMLKTNHSIINMHQSAQHQPIVSDQGIFGHHSILILTQFHYSNPIQK